MRKVSWRRPIASYAKVETLIGGLIRGRPSQLRKKRIRNLQYLDIGCGRNVHEKFIDLDYLWHAQVDVCWDIKHRIPFPKASMKGVFIEHCLEHFSLPVAFDVLGECWRVLAPGSRMRIIVPHAELYLELYHRRRGGDENALFPIQESESFNDMYSPIMVVNRSSTRARTLRPVTVSCTTFSFSN